MRVATALLLAVLVLAGCGKDEATPSGKPGDRDASGKAAEAAKAVDEAAPGTPAPGTPGRADGRARQAALELAAALEGCKTEKEGFSGCSVVDAEAEARSISRDGFSVVAQTEAGVSYAIRRRNDGSQSRRCFPRGEGDCPSDGRWAP